MSSEHYGYGEDPQNPTRLEIAERQKKKLQETGDWRDKTINTFDSDAVFRTIVKSRKQKQQGQQQSHVKQGAILPRLEDIEDPTIREIMQKHYAKQRRRSQRLE